MQTAAPPVVAPTPPPAGIPADKAIELIQAQIAGVKKEIVDLTAQVTNDIGGERSNIIRMQIESATDRLESLEGQLDRAIAGVPIVRSTVVRPDNPDDIPPRVQSLLEMGMGIFALVLLGYPLVRMIARRLEPRPRTDATDYGTRFERLEQAVDAVAIEVERISEGQRFTNRILSEAKALPAPNPLEQWPPAVAEKDKLRAR